MDNVVAPSPPATKGLAHASSKLSKEVLTFLQPRGKARTLFVSIVSSVDVTAVET